MNYRESIKNVLPYVPGKTEEEIKRQYKLEKVVKLASNENPYGPTPKVKEYISNLNINIYPDNYVTNLREKLASFLDVDKDMLLFGDGSVEIIQMLSRILLNKGDNIVTELPSFSSYFSEAMIQGAEIRTINYNESYSFDLCDMIKLLDDKTKMIYLTNPNNPLGSALSYDEIISFISKVPENILIVVDEAYMEFVRDENVKSCIDIVKDYKNVCVLRTFSKAYGLAALRIGYIVASDEVIENLEKVRVPFNVSTIAQNSALIALEEQDYMKEKVTMNHKVIDYVYDELDKLNLKYIKTQANFICINVNKDCNEISKKLLEKGYIVRGGFPLLDTWLRVSIGTMEEMRGFIKALTEVI